MGASLLVVGGCGYKDHPVPPATVVPEAIADLRYETDEKGVTLTWSYPMETIRGTEIDRSFQEASDRLPISQKKSAWRTFERRNHDHP